MSRRKRMPNRRAITIETIAHDKMMLQIGVGRYPDGHIAEVFVETAKGGTTLQQTARDAATMISIALQHGVPLAVLHHAAARIDGVPQSPIGAVLDYLAAEARSS